MIKFRKFLKERLLTEATIKSLLRQNAYPNLKEEWMRKLALASPQLYKREGDRRVDVTRPEDVDITANIDPYMNFLFILANRILKETKRRIMQSSGRTELADADFKADVLDKIGGIEQAKATLKAFDQKARSGNSDLKIGNMRTWEDVVNSVPAQADSRIAAYLARRMQIFEKAKSKGFQVFVDNNEFIAGVPATFESSAVFGDSRPEANRTNGSNPDNPEAIGYYGRFNGFQRGMASYSIYRISDIRNETRWCTTGRADTGHGTSQYEYHMNVAEFGGPLIYMCEKKTGMLFAYNGTPGNSNFTFKNEGDTAFGQDGNPEHEGSYSNDTFYYKKYCELYPHLPEYMSKCEDGYRRYLRGLSPDNMRLDGDNMIVVQNQAEAKAWAKFAEDHAGIYIDTKLCDGFFSGIRDLLIIKKLRIKEGTKSLAHLFAESNVKLVGEITGLGDVEDVTSMFYNCSHLESIGKVENMPKLKKMLNFAYGSVKLAKFNESRRLEAPHCDEISNAFRGTDLEKVPIEVPWKEVGMSSLNSCFKGCDVVFFGEELAEIKDGLMEEMASVAAEGAGWSYKPDEKLLVFDGSRSNWSESELDRLSDILQFAKKLKITGDGAYLFVNAKRRHSGNGCPAARFDHVDLEGMKKEDAKELFRNFNVTKMSIVVLPRNVTSLYGMFQESKLVEAPKIDLQGVENTSFMFADCSNLEKYPGYDTHDVKDFNRMFYGCRKLKQANELIIIGEAQVSDMFAYSGIERVPDWFDLSEYTGSMYHARNMFNHTPIMENREEQARFNAIIAERQRDSIPKDERGYYIVTDQEQAKVAATDPECRGIKIGIEHVFSIFSNAPEVEKLPPIDMKGVTIANSMFSYMSNLKKIEKLENCSELSGIGQMFYHCPNLEEIPEGFEDCCKNVQSIEKTFYDCIKLKKIKGLHFDKLINANYAFRSCGVEKFEDCSFFKNSAGQIIASCMFFECNNLKEMPEVYLSKARKTDRMFEGCISLEVINEIDIGSEQEPAGTLTNAMFIRCSKLKLIKKIKGGVWIMPRYMFARCENLKLIGGAGLRKIKGIRTPAAKMFLDCPLSQIYSVNGTKLINMLNSR